MAENPIGTVTDRERLVPLHANDGEFTVDVTEPVRMADVPEEGSFAWSLREAGDVPRLALAPVDDADEAGALPVRELSTDGERLTIDVPDPLVDDGLDLDAETYDDDAPLLFRSDEITDGVAVGMDAGGEPGAVADVALELVPLRYADGRPYRNEPVDDGELDSDPVAEAALDRENGGAGAPRSESISAPIDAPILDDVVETTGVPREPVVGALEAMTRHELVGEADDDTPYEPLTADDRVLVGLDDATWRDEVVPELDVDDATAEATREVHARQADVLLGDAEDARERFEGRTPVVLQRGREYDSGSDPPWDPE